MSGGRRRSLGAWGLRVVPILVVLLGVSLADAADFVWDGTCGGANWYSTCVGGQCSSSPPQSWVYNNWGGSACGSSPGPGFPGATDNVFLGGYTVQLTSAATTYHLTNPSGVLTVGGQPAVLTPLGGLSNGGQIIVVDGATLVGGNNTLDNDGAIILRYGGMWGCGILRCDADTLLTGAGALDSECGVLTGVGTLTNDIGHTVHGGNGQLAVPIVNYGLVSADVPGSALVLKTTAKSNAGTMRAFGAGLLDIQVGIAQEPTGVIRAAGAGSKVRLYSGASIVGGTLAGEDGGLFTCGGAQTATLTDLTNLAECQFSDGATLALAGTTLVNEGQIGLYYGGMYGGAHLRFDQNVALVGGGEVLISNGEIDAGPGVSGTNAAGHTIRGGDGYIDAALSNAGLISADVSGQALALREQPKANSGLIEATGGGFLDVYVAVNQTEDGEMRAAGANSRVRLHNGASIVGGALAGEGGGLFTAGGNETVTFADVTNVAECRFSDGATLALAGTTLTNEGEIGLYYGGMYGRGHLRFDENVALTGGGGVYISNGEIDAGPGVSGTNAAGHTIRGGDGYIDAALSNAGLISADVSGQALALREQPKANGGVIEATGGGLLDLHVPVTQTAAGLIRSTGAGSRVRLHNGGSIVGGTLLGEEGGLFTAGGAETATFTDVTNAAECQFFDGARLVVTGATLVNEGKIGLYYGGMYGGSHLRLDESVRLDGAGEILVDTGDVATGADVTVTNGPQHTIHGRGPLNVALLNEGTVAADWAGATLTINPQAGGVTNAGQMTVLPGCTMTLNSAGLVTQPAGELRVDGVLNIGSGPLALAGGELTGVGTVNGSVVSTGATVAPGDSAGELQINGNYTQGSGGVLQIELGGPNVGEFDRLSVSGAATLDGTLHVDLIGGYYPTPGQQFVILTAGNVTGGFPTVTGFGEYSVTCTANQVTITLLAPPVCRGDANCDGQRDTVDVGYFAAGLRGEAAWHAYCLSQGIPPSGCTHLNCDANGDGTVSFADVRPFVRLLGEPCP